MLLVYWYRIDILRQEHIIPGTCVRLHTGSTSDRRIQLHVIVCMHRKRSKMKYVSMCEVSMICTQVFSKSASLLLYVERNFGAMGTRGPRRRFFPDVVMRYR